MSIGVKTAFFTQASALRAQKQESNLPGWMMGQTGADDPYGDNRTQNTVQRATQELEDMTRVMSHPRFFVKGENNKEICQAGREAVLRIKQAGTDTHEQEAVEHTSTAAMAA